MKKTIIKLDTTANVVSERVLLATNDYSAPPSSGQTYYDDSIKINSIDGAPSIIIDKVSAKPPLKVSGRVIKFL